MIDQTQLAEALGQLDAGTRALLDLSLRRAIPDDKVAKVLGVDAASIPPKRARGIAELTDAMAIPGPTELAALLLAIPDLPEKAWGVPAPGPFAGNVSRAKRAKAFRRVAVAATPLVAVGAVMAAVLVSSGDHSGGGSGSGGAQRGAGAGGAGGGAAATASAPEARHGLPPGLTLAHRGGSHRVHHATARRHRSRHAAGAAEPAVLARHPVQTVSHSEPVAFHPAPAPAPVQTPSQPKHVTHPHHHAPVKPHVPTSAPAPAPLQTPSQPVSAPAPTAPSTSPVQINAPTSDNQTSSAPAPTPVKPPKTSPPQVDLNPPQQSASHEDGDHDYGSGGCSHRGGGYGSGDDDDQGSSHHDDQGSSHHDDQGSSHHDWQGSAHQQGSNGGRRFSPPGLFRRRH